MESALLVFAGFVAHAWISKIASPGPTVNAVAWVVGLLLTIVVLWLVLTRLGLVHS